MARNLLIKHLLGSILPILDPLMPNCNVRKSACIVLSDPLKHRTIDLAFLSKPNAEQRQKGSIHINISETLPKSM